LRYRLALLAALLVTAAVYFQTIFFQFVYDDFGQIVYNPKIKSWHLALTYFRSHVWSQSMDLGLYYRPLYMLWLRGNDAVFGLDPMYWHLTTIAMHLIVCLLLYLFVRRLVHDRWTAVVAALLFGLHPAHVETVAWVSGTTESLVASLLLGSLLCYWKRLDGSDRPEYWLAASLILAFFASLVKETAIVLPALIFGYEWIFAQSASWKAKFLASLRAALPYLAISILFLLMRTLALKSLTPPPATAGRLRVLMAWPEAVSFYVSHLLLPFHMSVFYKLMTVTHPGLLNFVFPGALMFIGAIGLYLGSRRSQVFAFLAVWWVVLMVPALNVTLWNNSENLHDRYLYLPSVAVCIALACLLERLRVLNYRLSAWGALLAIAAGYAAITYREMQYWSDDYTLAERGIEVSPGHPIAPQLLGNVLIRQDRPAEAIPFFIEALDALPSNIDTLCNLSYCYTEINALRLAEETVKKALAVKPSEPRAHLVLGIIRQKQQRLDEAEAEFERGLALQRVPQGVTLYHYYLGSVLYAKGDVKGALREYRLELQNDPSIDPVFARARERIQEIERGPIL